MPLLKTIWGLFFRLFPCPSPTGLIRIGNPNSRSPVLLTCNFHLTVERLKRVLRGTDTWLLVADSKGVNVWCAAGGDEFNTHSVVSALKTSGIDDRVDHRTVILLDHTGHSYAEIANILDVEVGTVKSRLCRARAHMREILTGKAAPGAAKEPDESARRSYDTPPAAARRSATGHGDDQSQTGTL